MEIDSGTLHHVVKGAADTQAKWQQVDLYGRDGNPWHGSLIVFWMDDLIVGLYLMLHIATVLDLLESEWDPVLKTDQYSHKVGTFLAQ